MPEHTAIKIFGQAGRVARHWFYVFIGRGKCSCGAVVILAIACMLGACAGRRQAYEPGRKIAPAALQKEVDIVWQSLKQCHPGIDWYRPYDSINGAFTSLRHSITDSLTEQQFRLRLSKAIALINCGHTTVQVSKAAAAYRPKKRSPVFPLQLKIWDRDSAVIVGNAYAQDSILIRGVKLHSINGKPIGVLVDSMCQHISGDGWHQNFKWNVISRNFGAWYKNLYGLAGTYTLDITDTLGMSRKAFAHDFDVERADSLRKAALKQAADSGHRAKHLMVNRVRSAGRKLVIDTAHGLAIMELNSFTGLGLRPFFKRSFRTIARRGISNLVVELRQNGGGNINKSTRLTRYLSDHSFSVADTVAARCMRYPFARYVKNGWLYRLQSLVATRRMADGRLHYRYFERKKFHPKKLYHFNGRVFIITGGLSFSASNLFLHPLKGQQNITIIGEETGGAAYGNCAINIVSLKLPHSKLRVQMPLYRLVIDHNLPHDGHGMLPDIVVPPGSWWLAHRIDPKMLKVYELLLKQ